MRKKVNGVAFVFYPDSCDKDTIDKLLDYYPIAISPLHCRDLDDNGKLKKPHYHCLVQGNLFADDKRIISNLTKMFYFEPIYNFYEYYEYLWHYKNGWYISNKAQYWKGDVKYGVRWSNSFIRIVYDDFDLLCSIRNIIIDNDLFEYCDFVDFIIDNCSPNIIDYALSHTMIIKSYIDSKRFKYLDFKKNI